MHGKESGEVSEQERTEGGWQPQTPKPAVGRPRTKQLLGAPFEFVAEVCRLTRGRATAMVAQCIYRRTIVCDCLTVNGHRANWPSWGSIDNTSKRP